MVQEDRAASIDPRVPDVMRYAVLHETEGNGGRVGTAAPPVAVVLFHAAEPEPRVVIFTKRGSIESALLRLVFYDPYHRPKSVPPQNPGALQKRSVVAKQAVVGGDSAFSAGSREEKRGIRRLRR